MATFEQGWAARLDRLNRAVTDLYMADMLTDSQMAAIREKKMPKAVGKAVALARHAK